MATLLEGKNKRRRRQRNGDAIFVGGREVGIDVECNRQRTKEERDYIVQKRNAVDLRQVDAKGSKRADVGIQLRKSQSLAHLK